MGTPLFRKRILRLSNRGTAMRFALLLFGALMGALLAFWIGNLVDFQIARENLAEYTNHLVDQGELLEAEAARNMAEIAHDGMLPCSEPDLSRMRTMIIASEHIADAGRIRDGRLLCSAVTGRLPKPLSIPEPQVVAGESSTWTAAWPVIPTSLHGHFIESGGVFVAINEQTLRDHEAPPPIVTADLLFDRRNHRMLKSFGPDVPLPLDEIVRGAPVERDGVLYQPVCRPSTTLCVVSSVPRAAILKPRWTVLLLRVAVGALLGMLLAAVAILLDFRRQSLEAQLRRAIRHGELAVAYQPIVNIATGSVVGAEALARWIKQDGEIVPPDVFISLAEDRGFVVAITRLVIDRIIRDLGDLLVHGVFRINLNITAQDLGDASFLPELERRLGAANIPRGNLGLELTERSTADPVVGSAVLSSLKEAGYTLYIDDFGTGYSSLAYLHRLSVDAIKIDRAFTQTVGTDSVTASVVPQIVAMAKQLELHIVIEGIETREQAQYFRDACPECHAQGWLYGRAMPAADLRTIVEAQQPLLSPGPA